MKELVAKYLSLIRLSRDRMGPINIHSLDYWQYRLFTNSIAVIIPLSLIAIIPGIYFSLVIKAYHIVALDIFGFLGLLVIAFLGRWMDIWLRKSLFIATLMAVSFFLVDFIGPHGPGILYMLAAVIFALLIFPSRYAFYWSYIVTALCLGIGTLIKFDMATNAELNSVQVTEWFAVSINVVFLSFLFSILIPSLMEGLGRSLEKQELLKHELVAKNQDLEHFTYYVSHDLQQPLRTVASFVKLYESKYADKLDEKGLEYLHHIKQGSEHMQHMVRELLNFSRAGNNTGSSEIIELGELVERVKKIHAHEIEAKNALVTCDSRMTLLANRTGMVEILQNLIENALKYSRPGLSPVIRIEGVEKKDHWEISVLDNGIGIDPSYFEKIFVIFERLHGNGEFPGTGIGLAVVKKICAKMGGVTGVESVPGKGSRFYFTIPR